MATKSLESDTSTRLRKVVAAFFEVGEDEVGPAFLLQSRRGQGSIARAALDSAIRRTVGLKSRLVYSARTYGELAAALVPGSTRTAEAASLAASPVKAPDAAPATPAEAPAAGAVRCGIDIEWIDHLPTAADYWEHPFYRDHFTPAEIAHCLLKETPALHFAARWCAKEALKKCDNVFLTTAMNDIEVVADDSGAPFLVQHANGRVRRLPHAVSLSHTPHAALAVVVKVDLPAVGPPWAPQPPAVTVPPPTSTPQSGQFMPTLLSLIAICVALGAIVRTFLIVK